MMKLTTILIACALVIGEAAVLVPAIAQGKASCACGLLHKGQVCDFYTGKQHDCSCDKDPKTKDVCK